MLQQAEVLQRKTSEKQKNPEVLFLSIQFCPKVKTY